MTESQVIKEVVRTTPKKWDNRQRHWAQNKNTYYQSDEIPEFAHVLYTRLGVNFRSSSLLGAWYQPNNDIICLPHSQCFKSEAAITRITLHELIHWTKHQNRADRSMNPWHLESVAIEELVAEIGTMLLLTRLKFPLELMYSLRYIAHWKTHASLTSFRASIKSARHALQWLWQETPIKEFAA